MLQKYTIFVIVANFYLFSSDNLMSRIINCMVVLPLKLFSSMV